MARLVRLASWLFQQATAVPDLASRTAAWPEARPAATWLLLVARQHTAPPACSNATHTLASTVALEISPEPHESHKFAHSESAWHAATVISLEVPPLVLLLILQGDGEMLQPWLRICTISDKREMLSVVWCLGHTCECQGLVAPH